MADASGESCDPLRYTVSMVALEPEPVAAIELDPKSAELTVGQSLRMNATVVPSWADDLNVSWSVSDSEIAEIDSSGQLTGLKTGSVEVICQGGDGKSDRAQIQIVE